MMLTKALIGMLLCLASAALAALAIVGLQRLTRGRAATWPNVRCASCCSP